MSSPTDTTFSNVESAHLDVVTVIPTRMSFSFENVDLSIDFVDLKGFKENMPIIAPAPSLHGNRDPQPLRLLDDRNPSDEAGMRHAPVLIQMRRILSYRPQYSPWSMTRP